MDIAVIELENKIRKMVESENNRIVIFDYEMLKPKVSLSDQGASMVKREILTVLTLNQETKEVSVMYKSKGEKERVVALQEVLHYLEIIKPSLSPYHLRWKKKGEPGESELSYFYCNDALEVLEKFFETRKREEYVIYSLEMKGYS